MKGKIMANKKEPWWLTKEVKDNIREKVGDFNIPDDVKKLDANQLNDIAEIVTRTKRIFGKARRGGIDEDALGKYNDWTRSWTRSVSTALLYR